MLTIAMKGNTPEIKQFVEYYVPAAENAADWSQVKPRLLAELAACTYPACAFEVFGLRMEFTGYHGLVAPQP